MAGDYSIQEKKSSFERIRYGVRPAKSIERKMLGETFQRLSAFERLDRYKYVGFGSTYFTDFILFHRTLGITDMVSVEREVLKQERFRFNCPYRCVRIEFGESTEVLPQLSWDARTILWLDYDNKLNRDMLSDVKHACANAPSGSVVVVTVNAQPEGYGRNKLQELKKRVGEDKVPIDVRGKHLLLWGTAVVCRRIIVNEIKETLRERNGGLSEDDKIEFKQLFNFHYQDGAMMLTVGGLLYERREASLAENCAFEQLSFFRDGDEPYLIEAPCLTYREIRHLDTYLPQNDPEALNELDWLPREDIEKYAKVYRYFPNFVEAELT